jgi:3-dehydroquinate synthase
MDITVTSKKVSSYNIVTKESFDELSSMLKDIFPDIKCVCLVSDSNVFPLYEKEVKEELKKIEGLKVHEYVFKAGEASKDMSVVEDLAKYLLSVNFSRSDVVISIGGGVVSDLSGFVSSIYKRGVAHVNLPTTLLAMADASIGGKTGVDFEGIKNTIGVFDMPSLIYMNLSTLDTLPDREYYSGFAEIMKHGLIADQKFYMWLIENMYEICDKDKETIANMLETSINIKKAVVERDPFEKGDRALLNFGHSIGHAVESYFAGEYLHGEALSLGCVAEAYISWKSNMISMEDYYEIRDMFVPFNLPISIQVDKKAEEEIFKRLLNDKKNDINSINIVLLNKIGKATLIKGVDQKLIKEAISEINFKDED